MMRPILMLCVAAVLLAPSAAVGQTGASSSPAASADSASLGRLTVDGKDYEAEFRQFLAEEQRKRLSRFRYMMLGYGLIWLCLGSYLFSMNRRIGQVGRELYDLKGRLEDARRSAGR